MKLLSRSISHDGITTPDWERITTKWDILTDLNDDFQGNTSLWEKFNRINVEQRKTIIDNEVITWIKGSRTNMFCPDTKDKNKKKVVEMLNTFLLSIDEPLLQPYIDVLSFEYIEMERIQEEKRQIREQQWLEKQAQLRQQLQTTT
jgi:hypothetical protein